MSTINSLEKAATYEADLNLSQSVKEFLKPLNGGGNPPLESLSVADTRNVLILNRPQ